MLPRLAAVLFDLDGTLLDHDSAVTGALRAWLSSYGLSQQEIEAAIPLWYELDRRPFPAWRAGEISFFEQRRRRIRDFLPALGRSVRTDQLDGVWAEYFAYYEAGWAAFGDAAPALRRVAAAGLRIGVLTNGDQAEQTAKLAKIGLLDLAGPVFASSQLAAPKPDRRAYAEACERLDVDPTRALMVGDNYELDVVAARVAGLNAIDLDRYGLGHEDDRISTLHDLLTA